MKALAVKNKIKQIIINKNHMSITYYDDVDLNSLMQKVNKFKHFRFEKAITPTISVDIKFFSVQTAMNYFIEFLNS